MFPIRCLIVAASMALVSTPTNADFWSDAAGILTDPIKLNKGSENIIHAVERANIHAEKLRQRFNDDIAVHLKKFDGTVSDTRTWFSSEVDKIDKNIDKYFDKVSQLEKSFISDTREMVKCSVEVSSDIIKSNLAKSLNDLGKRKPRFVIFGFIKIGEIKLDSTDITSPIEGFREAKNRYDSILSGVSASDNYNKITDAYADIARLANLAKCHYNSDGQKFLELYMIELEYIRRGRAWIGLTSPV